MSRLGRLRWAVLVVLVMWAGACTRSTDTTTTTLPTTTTEGPRQSVSPPPQDSRLGEPIPIDPETRIGTLDNGLTYYIRFNDSPGQRAELRLAVDAGSVLEADDQLGGAHFLEHMMFNGTERFPRNELIAVLESFGPRFGPDINAYTNFDETVYQLGVPTDDDDLVELAVDVLFEWADRATIDPEEVDAEIGVVLEEWRLRDQGAQGRIGTAFNELVIEGTPYQGRLPIGSAESIERTTATALSRFYDDWYRPDLMAIVAVGDFDVDQMEGWIIDRFSMLSDPDSPPTRPDFPFQPVAAPRAVSLADPESPSAFAQVVWLTGSTRPATVGDLRRALSRQLAVSMFATRFAEDASRGTAPFFNASGLDFGYVRSFGVAGVAVDARPADLVDSVRAVVEESLRIRTFGFEERELDRALAEFEAIAEQTRSSQSTAQDTVLADELVEHFLAGFPIPSPEDRYEMSLEFAESITLEEVEQAFMTMTDSSPLTLVVGPAGSDVPSDEEVAQAVELSLMAEVEPRPDVGEDLDQLMAPPEPGEIVSRRVDESFGFVTIVYENETTVHLWPTEIADNSLVLRAQSFGGTSVIEIEDLPEAMLITEIVTRSGVGAADQVQLQRLLSDRVAGVDPYLDEVSEGFFGGAATEDAETLLQLVHLYMTAPRADPVAVTAVVEEQRPFAEAPEDVPQLLVTMALMDAYYGDDPRYFAVPSPDQLDDFDADRALQLFKERFANASDFVFAIVGDFDIDVMEDLTARYLGSLPGTGQVEAFVDNQPLPPRRVQITTVQAGQDPQGEVVMAFTNELASDARDRVVADVLSQVLNARLRDRIREELSASYSPSANIDLQLEPDAFAESFIQVSGDPQRLDEIAMAVLEVVNELRTAGPGEAQLATAIEQVRRAYELFNNPQLAEALLFAALHPGESVTELIDRYDVVGTVSAADVRELARVAFPTDARIEIRLIPRG